MTDATRPGDWGRSRERRGTFASLVRRQRAPVLFVIDDKVARLHPQVAKGTSHAPRLLLRAGEEVKSATTLEKIFGAATLLPRSGALVVVGGGTIGDVATVAAHLVKRGVRLVQVPTTLLAAVDSSLGGKGAIHVDVGGRRLKNGAGVFHYADETWICAELFTTLSERQIREGMTEAWKMAVCLDARLFASWRRRAPNVPTLVRESRRLKDGICARDPYETRGIREVLNFGHTFGHVIETISEFSVLHGEAVGLGMRCALDVGVLSSVTPASVRADIEGALEARVGILSRRKLATVLRRASDDEIFTLLSGDKKNLRAEEVRMVLLRMPGSTSLQPVPRRLLSRALRAWRDEELP